LGALGLVRRDGRQFAVIGFAPADVDRIAFVRVALEGAAADMAARAIEPKEIARLVTLVGKMDDAASKLDADTYRSLHRQFHRLIVQSADNPYLERAFESLMDLVDLVWESSAPGSARYTKAQTEHRKIIHRLKRRNPTEARRAMVHHIKSGMNLIRESLERKEGRRRNLRTLVEETLSEMRAGA
jgi:DNA-binding GntR family transcriptional regulator